MQDIHGRRVFDLDSCRLYTEPLVAKGFDAFLGVRVQEFRELCFRAVHNLLLPSHEACIMFPPTTQLTMSLSIHIMITIVGSVLQHPRLR